MRRVAVSDLKGDEVLAKSIITDNYIVILHEGATLRPVYIEKLKELNISRVFIQDDSGLEEDILILKDEMQEKVSSKIKEILEHHTYQHNDELKELCGTADSIIYSIIDDEEIAQQVYDIKERNADIYEHSLSICVLSVMTALKMKLDQDTVHSIGVGCLLHDIGLRYLTIDYENQDVFALSPKDEMEYKKHPVYGYSALKDEIWISDISKNIILYHHERLDGSGFPLHAKSLSMPVQIVTVTDAFDEMICGIGTQKVKVYEAIEFLKTFRGVRFNPEIVDTFLELIAVYPAGTKVRTNQGEIGQVIRQNKDFPDRPVLLILEDANGTKYTEKVLKDLMKNQSLFIEEVIE